MKELEERILKDGKIINNDIIKVDSFLNHQVDTALAKRIGQFFREEFKDVVVDKVLTLETSGIPYAMALAEACGDVPFVFAKKSKSAITDEEHSYTAIVRSFTRNTMSTVTVNKNYLKPGERILIIDDFLAAGNAGLGLLDLCEQACATPVGFCSVIEKGFQEGRSRIEAKGVKVVSAAIIKEFRNNTPIF